MPPKPTEVEVLNLIRGDLAVLHQDLQLVLIELGLIRGYVSISNADLVVIRGGLDTLIEHVDEVEAQLLHIIRRTVGGDYGG